MSDAFDSCAGTDPSEVSSSLDFWRNLYNGKKPADFKDEFCQMQVASGLNSEDDWEYALGSLSDAFDSCAGTNPFEVCSSLDFWRNLYTGKDFADFEEESKKVASRSNLEADWGYVLGSLSKGKKAKRRKKDYGSCSTGNSTGTSDLSEALSSISAALSLSSSDSDQRDGTTDASVEAEYEDMLDRVTSRASIPYSQDDVADDRMTSSGDGYVQDRPAFEFFGRAEHEKTQAPQIGMEFISEEEAYLFYKSYAQENGFRVRKAKVQRSVDGTIRKRYIFCSRQGFRSMKQLAKETKYKRKETRTGCNAQVCFTAEDGKWVLTHCSLEHNHPLVLGLRAEGQMDEKTIREQKESQTGIHSEMMETMDEVRKLGEAYPQVQKKGSLVTKSCSSGTKSSQNRRTGNKMSSSSSCRYIDGDEFKENSKGKKKTKEGKIDFSSAIEQTLAVMTDNSKKLATSLALATAKSEALLKNTDTSTILESSTILECMKIMQEMDIDGVEFTKGLDRLHAMPMFQQLFLNMNDQRRKQWLKTLSIV